LRLRGKRTGQGSGQHVPSSVTDPSCKITVAEIRGCEAKNLLSFFRDCGETDCSSAVRSERNSSNFGVYSSHTIRSCSKSKGFRVFVATEHGYIFITHGEPRSPGAFHWL
jgi:hypothetical protein